MRADLAQIDRRFADTGFCAHKSRIQDFNSAAAPRIARTSSECLVYVNSLSIAADELQDRLPALTQHPANERNVYVIGLLRAKTGTSDPVAPAFSAMTMCRKNDDRSVKLDPFGVANATA